jgi:hypothetical protein
LENIDAGPTTGSVTAEPAIASQNVPTAINIIRNAFKKVKPGRSNLMIEDIMQVPSIL